MKTVLLAGSGHAHLEVLKSLTRADTSRNNYMLVSPSPRTFYSGLVPRLVMDELGFEQISIPSAEYARSKGVTYLQDSVVSFDRDASSVLLASGRRLPFDILSLNVGARPVELPSDSPAETIYLKPFDAFLERWRELQRTCSSCLSPNFAVVGGGPAAIEVAVALKVRLERNKASRSKVHLVSAGDRLCGGYSIDISKAIKTDVERLGIEVHLGETVSKIHHKHLLLRDERRIDFDAVFVATPNSETTLEERYIDGSLRIEENIFAAGDFAINSQHPETPRSGVTAVHQGRHLANAIRDRLKGLEPKPFTMKSQQLNILITGKNTARLVWGAHSVNGQIPFRLKNWIDGRYMKSFR